MRHFRQLPLTLAAALLLGTAPATAQKMDLTINVQTHNKNGICFLYFPLGEMELAISVKASNNNINVGVDDLPADVVEAGLDKENVPITLVLGNGKSVTTDGGAYRAGFQYRVSGYWEKTGDGAAILSYLKGGKEITAKVDGQSYGPFQIQQTTGPVKDYAYNWLKTCITENGGKPNF
ncbi:MAG TPA: hypothetical protein PKD48_08565 [Sphingopyxis sp.]|nr:hypothetical protein [Sphingopyxis sp.]HMQ20622.1 hypothetical protein [Sphingopyxis sp.]